ncbi:solute carrier family 2, facilitated glucose transporter member 1-like [Dysidea avara]|uniref:solute carrier family 2, facilitated glucose transporter member 1-like n=1 Tax=Dysidea avara TaxID=196820 RepID=UPI00331BEE93
MMQDRQEDNPPSSPLHTLAGQEHEPLVNTTSTATPGWTPILVLAVSSAVLGSSAQFGYNTGVYNSPQDAIRDSFEQANQSIVFGKHTKFSGTENSIAVAIFAVGGMVGALLGGFLADIPFLGRKYTMLANNVIIWIGALLEFFAVHPYMLIAGRFVVGINCGVNTVVAPMYITELAPISIRGKVGVLHQLAITIALLVSQVLGISKVLGQEGIYWRILLALTLVLSVYQLVTLPWCPRSPRFQYILRQDEARAIETLKHLRNTDDVSHELEEMKAELSELQSRPRLGLLDLIREPWMRWPLLISIGLHMSQQLSGINGIFYYSTDIFDTAGVTQPDLATILVGVVLVTVTIVSVILIERQGRKTLMLYGLGGMSISFILTTICFCFQEAYYSDSNKLTAPGVLSVCSALLVVFFFGIGPGSIPWFMVAELFLQDARPAAVTVAVIVNWSTNFVVGLTFQGILDSLYPYALLVFAGLCGFFWLFTLLFVPETKGKSVEDIVSKFKSSSTNSKPDH